MIWWENPSFSETPKIPRFAIVTRRRFFCNLSWRQTVRLHETTFTPDAIDNEAPFMFSKTPSKQALVKTWHQRRIATTQFWTHKRPWQQQVRSTRGFGPTQTSALHRLHAPSPVPVPYADDIWHCRSRSRLQGWGTVNSSVVMKESPMMQLAWLRLWNRFKPFVLLGTIALGRQMDHVAKCGL